MNFKLYFLIITITVVLLPYIYNTLKLKNPEDMLIPDEGQIVNLTNGKIYYRWYEPEIINDDEIIILVHGFSTPSFVWNGILEDLLSTGKKVLVYDHYGRGFSARPNAKYSLDFYVATLEELLLSLKIETKINIVGYSMGGPIAAEFASLNSEKIETLSLIAPAGYISESPWYLKVFTYPIIGDYVFRAFPNVFKSISASETSYSDDPKSINEEEFTNLFMNQTFYKGFTDALLSTIRNFDMSDSSIIYKKIDDLEIDSLVIWGTQDKVVPIKGYIELKKDIPSIKLEEIKEGTHDITYRQPSQVGAILKDFIKK
jgi:pimeloyl-ACP methyl ester carboxylesterase